MVFTSTDPLVRNEGVRGSIPLSSTIPRPQRPKSFFETRSRRVARCFVDLLVVWTGDGLRPVAPIMAGGGFFAFIVRQRLPGRGVNIHFFGAKMFAEGAVHGFTL